MTQAAAARAAAALLLAAALAAGCTAPRPSAYRAEDGGFGYSETRLDPATWRVVFAGNRASGLAQVEDYALYRAAQVTLGAGFERFAVIDRDVGQRIEEERGRRTIDIEARERRLGGTLTPGDTFYGESARTTLRHMATLVIRPYRGAPPAEALATHDARDVLRRLGSEVEGRR